MTKTNKPKAKEILVVDVKELDFYDAADYPKVPNELMRRIDDVNGKASSFVTTATEVLRVAIETERLLERQGLPKAKRLGVEVRHSGAGPTASSYKYAAKGTDVRLRRRSGGWYLVSAVEGRVYPKQGERRDIRITQDQAAIIEKASLKPFSVVRPVVPVAPAEPQLETA